MDNRIVARIEIVKSPQEGYLVRSPAVGILEGAPPLGAHVSPLAPFLTLRVLRRPRRLQLPLGVAGFVAESFVAGERTAVEHNQPLLRLSLAGGLQATSASSGASGQAAIETRADALVVTAPSEGVFYLRPKPGAPAYVSVGSTVATGAVLGLVEVMKCFNPIAYGGPGLPAAGTVVEVLVGDGAEVKFGQPLFRVKPQT